MDDDLLALHAQDRKGRRWSKEDDATLRRLAGKVELAQIAGTLHRTVDSVRMRAQKLGVDCHCSVPTLMRCPRCGQWRTYLRMGICRVCMRMDTRDVLVERERRLLYEVPESYRVSATDRRSEMRRDAGRGDRELDPVELERVLCARLDRENATRRRRCERMEKAIRSGYVENM